MKWLVIPIEELKRFDTDWGTRRKNVAGTEAILHERIYIELVPQLNEEVKYDYPLLTQDEAESLLSTEEWKINIM